MVFNATFHNISVISWLSILLVEEIEVPGENQYLVGSLGSLNVISTNWNNNNGKNNWKINIDLIVVTTS